VIAISKSLGWIGVACLVKVLASVMIDWEAVANLVEVLAKLMVA
jgi:hypothetical protein